MTAIKLLESTYDRRDIPRKCVRSGLMNALSRRGRVKLLGERHAYCLFCAQFLITLSDYLSLLLMRISRARVATRTTTMTMTTRETVVIRAHERVTVLVSRLQFDSSHQGRALSFEHSITPAYTFGRQKCARCVPPVGNLLDEHSYPYI